MNVEITSLSSKGQVIVPNRIRRSLGIGTGTKMMVFTDGKNIMLKPVEPPMAESFKALIQASREFAKKNKIKKSDVAKAIKKVRNENRR